MKKKTSSINKQRLPSSPFEAASRALNPASVPSAPTFSSAFSSFRMHPAASSGGFGTALSGSDNAAAPLVECPVCSAFVAETRINDHLDAQCQGHVAQLRSVEQDPSTEERESGNVEKAPPQTSPDTQMDSAPLHPFFSTRNPSQSTPPSALASTSRPNLKRPHGDLASTPTSLSTSPQISNPSAAPPPLSTMGPPVNPFSLSSKRARTAAADRAAPLAEAARPSNLDEVIGQDDLVGPTALLRMLVEQKRVPSLILWGPPGTGKTCLARIIARSQGGFYRELSAVTDNLPGAKKILEEAASHRRMHSDGPRPVVFVDELHRFTKAQQDFFLPGVEKGDYTLLAATTENPSFRINSALLSRCRVFTLSKLAPSAVEAVVRRGLAIKVSRILDGWDAVVGMKNDVEGLMEGHRGDRSRPPTPPSTERSETDDIELSGDHQTSQDSSLDRSAQAPHPTLYLHPDVPQLLAKVSDGDARVALNALDMAVDAVVARHKLDGVTSLQVCPKEVMEALQKTHLLYDQKGDQHYEIISALHKSMRGGDADAAIYWLGRMLYAGEDPLYVARRLVRFAVEDVGLADPSALPLAVSAWQAAHYLGMPECDVVLGQCAVYLARASKSVEVYRAMGKVKEYVQKERAWPVPLHLRNAPTSLMKDLGYSEGYQYNPDFADRGEVVTQAYLPPEMNGIKFL
ncbi:P-loop containing nucleoside triphosphate hydrolase protein [Gonapodya prolifera JEL478]|uniref:p-loop containing nucleoside triphosphate hydrolase protein n=1 Tax=Gonapodya prolifera (strain JEL478) TaxID=1344416 RepID=A0A139ANY7_GONPJ|nr:P-loop containing nucleoside triphosphate hydrolase protein [Gonapodya prolifera JEL478]|eukprot:KXS18205.1 P-loop containing nucleoside triphosphate hydrolase protein [Gonapodya prolifera JEL478]